MGPLTLPPPDSQGIDHPPEWKAKHDPAFAARVRGGGPSPALLALAVALAVGLALLGLLASCGSDTVTNRASSAQVQGTAYDVNAIQSAIVACDARGGYSAIYRGAAYCSKQPIAIAGAEEP